jgi:chemotaxis signal transduction protein
MSSHPSFNDQYCVFQANDSVWAIAAASVREIADTAPIVVVPEAPSEVVGVCHIRMEFVPVLSLPGLLGEAGGDRQNAAFLLILDGGEGPWALPIQRALSLHTLEIAVGEAALDGQRRSTGILGTASFRDQVLRIVDASWLYRRAHDLIENHWKRELQECHEADSSATATAL